jgi:thiamine pyridinylase
MSLIDRLADNAHRKDNDDQVAKAYDSGIGQGYIGYSESIRLLRNRLDKTGIKSVSFSDRENIQRVYVDAAAVTAGVKGKKYEKCLELMNVMAESDIMTDLSVQDGKPQYLMLARKSPYKHLAEQFALYSELEKLANNEKNHVILTP